MFKFVSYISEKMVCREIILQEDKDIYSYGLECLFLKIIHITSYFLIAVMLHSIKELFFVLLVLIPLRENAGGYHARTRIGCYFASCLTILACLFFYKVQLKIEVYYFFAVIATITFLKLAPMDNENKRFIQSEKIFYRRRSMQILIAVIAISIFTKAINQENISILCIIGIEISAFSLGIQRLIEISHLHEKRNEI